jgi:hypothetical protein
MACRKGRTEAGINEEGEELERERHVMRLINF